MLKNIFNAASRALFPLPDLSKQPVILVSTMGHDKTTGDAHGFTGLGKIVAEKLNGIYYHLDEDILKQHYPDDMPYAVLPSYMQKIGNPDIVFARNYSWQIDPDRLAKRDTPFIISAWNEQLTRRYTTETDLVAHHLTPSLLQNEGEAFLKEYPALPRPLVAIIMADNTCEGLPEKLISRLGSYQKATIFVCSSRRTLDDSYRMMMNGLESNIEAADAQDKIRLLGYNFARKGVETHMDFTKGAFSFLHSKEKSNPYIGLLHTADHIIVCGNSQSIIAEALATGKTVHHYGSSPYSTLQSRGFVHSFNESTNGHHFETRTISPLNITETIADGIITAYRHDQKKKQGLRHAIGAYLNGP